MALMTASAPAASAATLAGSVASPATSAATLAGSVASPATSVTRGSAPADARAGSRTTPTTSCPRASASPAILLPMCPVTPKTAIFIAVPLLARCLS
jgi:hypothetical protein